MRKLIVLLFASLIVSGGGVTATAEADTGNPFDVYGMTAKPFHVNTGSCRHLPISAKVTAAADYQDISAEVDVWRGGKYLGTASLEGDGASKRLTGDYYYCPGLDGAGTFRLGASEIVWEQYDDDFNYYNRGEFTDAARGSLVVKQASRASLKTKRQGKKLRLRSAGQYFATDYPNGWYRFPKGTRMGLQRHPVGDTGVWTRIKVARTNKSGVATFKIKPKATYRYRVLSPATARRWLTKSRVVTR